MEVENPIDYEEIMSDEERPGFEYEFLPKFLAYMASTVRMSLGDNDFGAVPYMGDFRGSLFWVIWFLIAYILFIIFMNFIITEACIIYEAVI